MRDHVIAAFKQVVGFASHGMGFEADERRVFESGLQSLIAPHLPKLVDDRAEFLKRGRDESWSDQLDQFIRSSLMPGLGISRRYVERNRAFVALLLDVAIEKEQYRADQNCPATSFVRPQLGGQCAN